MKRITVLMCVVLVFSMLLPMTVMAEDKIYNDVGYDKWYSRAVFVMKDEEVMKGDYFGFRPSDNITRAEFVTILSRLADADTEAYTEAAFDDAPIDAWYGKVIAWAKAEDLVDGYSETSFGPDDPITREQMCVILANFIEKYTVALTEGEGKSFADGDKISEWAKDAVAKCGKWGVVSGMENNTFCPADTANRAQIAQLFYNLLLNAEPESSGIEIPDYSGESASTPFLNFKGFPSFGAFANYLMKVTESEVDYITRHERLQYSYLDERISDDEFKYGFFGSFLRKRREDKTVLYPCIDGKEIALTEEPNYSQVSFHPSYTYKKPEVRYIVLENIWNVSIKYLDEELCKQGEEKGASWLIRTLNEKTLNVHNYEEIKKKQLEIGDDVYEHLEVYEKEYKLADRTVKALVEDNSAREESPYMNILFVYDGALIQVKVITDNDEEILSTLSFTHKSLE